MLFLTLADTTWRIVVPTLALATIGLYGDVKFQTPPLLTLLGTFVGFGLASVLIRQQLGEDA